VGILLSHYPPQRLVATLASAMPIGGMAAQMQNRARPGNDLAPGTSGSTNWERLTGLFPSAARYDPIVRLGRHCRTEYVCRAASRSSPISISFNRSRATDEERIWRRWAC
jgi:hypothetical protein